jgi:hypothetical protein
MGNGIIALPFLTSALPTLPLYPLGIDPVAHCVGSWVGLRGGLDVMGKRKISYPNPVSNPKSLIVQPLV